MRNQMFGNDEFRMKSVCHKCKRSGFCRDISKEMRQLRTKNFLVWDKDSQSRLQAASAELDLLRFSYPNSQKLCHLRNLSYQDLLDFIHYINTIDPERSA